MTVAYWTSRVIAAQRAAKVRLEAQVWPPHPVTGALPQITTTISGDPEMNSEIVAVSADVGEDGSIEAARNPNGRNEEFALVVHVGGFTYTDEDDANDRAEVLKDVVENAFVDSTGALIMFGTDVGNQSSFNHLEQVAHKATRFADGQIFTETEIRFRLHFRI